MATKRKKKEPGWDQIGKMIGAKMEKEFKNKECASWKKPWMFHHKEHGGGFGRFLFIIGVLIALSTMGLLVNVPIWVIILIVIGFTLMRL